MEKKKLIRQGIGGGKKWTKPKLIILTRGKPEEATLLACRALPKVTPIGDNNGCWWFQSVDFPCVPCGSEDWT